MILGGTLELTGVADPEQLMREGEFAPAGEPGPEWLSLDAVGLPVCADGEAGTPEELRACGLSGKCGRGRPIMTPMSAVALSCRPCGLLGLPPCPSGSRSMAVRLPREFSCRMALFSRDMELGRELGAGRPRVAQGPTFALTGP